MDLKKLNQLRRMAGVNEVFTENLDERLDENVGLGTQAVSVGSTTSNPDNHVMPQLNAHELDYKGDYENEEEDKNEEDKNETDDDFKKGDHVEHNGETRVVVIADAKADFVGVVPVGQEHDIEAVDLVHAHELTKVAHDEEDNAEYEEDNMEYEEDSHEEDNMEYEEDSHEEDEHHMENDDTPGHGWARVDNEGGAPLYRKIEESHVKKGDHVKNKSGHVGLVTNVSGDGDIADVKWNDKDYKGHPSVEMKDLTVMESMHHHSDGHYPETYTDAKSHKQPVNVSTTYDTVNDKPEFEQEEEDYEMSNDTEKVQVPSRMLTDLKKVITSCEEEGKVSERRDDTPRQHYYEETAKALQAVHDYMNDKTIEGLKRAQLMVHRMANVSRALIPDHVWKFIVDGGVKRSLKDYHNEVKGYPILGPRNTLDDNN